MENIIRGTTPTIKYTFSTVDPSDFTAAFITIVNGATKTEKDLTTATIGENYISWTLTQAETLALGDKIDVMLNWKLADGTRGASKKSLVFIDANLKEAVI